MSFSFVYLFFQNLACCVFGDQAMTINGSALTTHIIVLIDSACRPLSRKIHRGWPSFLKTARNFPAMIIFLLLAGDIYKNAYVAL